MRLQNQCDQWTVAKFLIETTGLTRRSDQINRICTLPSSPLWDSAVQPCFIPYLCIFMPSA